MYVKSLRLGVLRLYLFHVVLILLFDTAIAFNSTPGGGRGAFVVVVVVVVVGGGAAELCLSCAFPWLLDCDGVVGTIALSVGIFLVVVASDMTRVARICEYGLR